MNIQSNKSIDQLIKDIDNNKILLPEFQRDFRWPVEKSETLFDSLFRNLFIGSLILSKPKFNLACKGFDLRPRGSKARKPKPTDKTLAEFENNDIYTLLDGQQRVTSIYRAFKGIDLIHVELKDMQEIEELFDADNKFTGNISQVIEGFIAKKPKDGIFYLTIFDMCTANTGYYREQRIKEEYIYPRFEEGNYSTEDRDKLEEVSLHLFSHFNTSILKRDSLISVQLLDMDLDKFCLYFERSNSQGLNLSFTDIVTAKVYTQFKLGASIERAKQQHGVYFNDKLIDGLVRYINFKANGEVTKASILKGLSGEHFTQYWETTVEDLVYVQKWIEEQRWVFRAKDLPYKTMLFPLLSFYQNLRSKEFTQATESQSQQLKLWFFSSMLDYRYGGARHGSTNVVFKKDCVVLKDLANERDIKQTYWLDLSLDLDYDTLLRVDADRSAIALGVNFYLWHLAEFKNLENSNNVSFGGKIDVHHVYPNNFLKTKFKGGDRSDEYDLSDSMLNKIRIGKISNIRINDKSPSEYLTEMSSVNTGLQQSLSSHYIYDHEKLINGDMDMDYMSFLKSRYDAISVALNPITQSLKAAQISDLSNITL